MIYEFAHIDITPGAEDAFVEAAREAAPLFQRAEGCLSMRLDRVIETPGRYLLVVGWTSVEAHEVRFRGSEDFKAWRALVGPHLAGPPQVIHTETTVAAFG